MKCRIWSVLALIFICSACRTTQTNAPAPAAAPASAAFPKQLSTINIPVALNLKELENKINREFKGVLYDDNSYENNNNDNLMLRVTKLDNFSISGSGDQFLINAPIEIYVKGRMKKDLFNIFDRSFGVDQSKDATFRMNVKVKTRLNLTPDWDVKTISETGFDWREKPYLEIGPVRIPIGSVIEGVVNGQISEINKRLDLEISRNIRIKPLIEQYWRDMQQPVLVNETYKSYLQIIPEEVFLSPLRSNGQQLLINVGIKTQLNLYTGSVPLHESYKPLPKLRPDQKPDSTFSLFMSGDITYDYATELVRREFLNKTFSFENNKQVVTITDLKVFGSDNKLALMIGMNGSTKQGLFRKKFKGTVYALGVPVYDEKTQTLSVKDFDFDLKSKDVLVGAAEWIFKGTLKKSIESKLSYSMKAELDAARKLAQDAMTNTDINKNVRLNGKLVSLQPAGIYVGEKSVQVYMKASGDLQVTLKNY